MIPLPNIPLGWKLIAAGVLGAALLALGYNAGSASKQRAWDKVSAKQVAAQLATSEQYRATEAALRAKLTEAEHAHQTETEASNRIVASLRAGNSRLRSDIANFASGPAGDPASPGTGRAVVIGQLLDTAVQTATECAGRGERDAGIARGLYAAWPVTP